jgi:hypothetical protein
MIVVLGCAEFVVPSLNGLGLEIPEVLVVAAGVLTLGHGFWASPPLVAAVCTLRDLRHHALLGPQLSQ